MEELNMTMSYVEQEDLGIALSQAKEMFGDQFEVRKQLDIHNFHNSGT
jgi:hypothetical protein